MRKRNRLFASAWRVGPTVSLVTCALWGCGASRPCSTAGDVAWPGSIRGDQICQQKLVGGQWVDNGKYVRKFANGKTAIEGQFLEGKKHGVWIQYDEKGEKLLERMYDHGVEVSSHGLGTGGSTSP